MKVFKTHKWVFTGCTEITHGRYVLRTYYHTYYFFCPFCGARKELRKFADSGKKMITYHTGVERYADKLPLCQHKERVL